MASIKSVNDHYQRENPQTKIVEPIPALELELENHLSDDEKLDLQFEKLNSFQAYQDVFKKVFTFTDLDEMKLVRSFIDKLRELDKNGTSYYISEGLNCSLAVETSKDKSIFNFKSPQLMDYVRNIIAWMSEPERYLGVKF